MSGTEGEPTFLGIDLGTQGLSAVVTCVRGAILHAATSAVPFTPGLPAGHYTQLPQHWLDALAVAMAALRGAPDSAAALSRVAAVGVAAQMHGEVLCDAAGAPLGAARLWCDERNAAEAEELTAALGVKIPVRCTAARWLWTLRNEPARAARVARLTTPAGFIAATLTGAWTLGVGDASGMLPIDPRTLDFDVDALASFDALAAALGARCPPPLRALLPRVCVAGGDGGALCERGAALLGLLVGTPVAPAEGDQPAALAGSHVAAAGVVAVGLGTSVVANAVCEGRFEGVARAVDHFCAVDGKPINMVWLKNGTTPLNALVRLFARGEGGGDESAFAHVLRALLAAPEDCGGLLALPFLDDEPGLGVARGGCAALVGLSERNSSLGCVARAALLGVLFNLRLGSEALDERGFARRCIALSGGLVREPALGQLVADVFDTAVVVLHGAEEGSARGAALLAAYRARALRGGAPPWESWLAEAPAREVARFEPRRASVVALSGMLQRYRALLAASAMQWAAS